MSPRDNQPEFRRPAWLFILLGFALAPLAPELPLLVIIAFADGASGTPFVGAGAAAIVTVGHIISLALGVPTFLVLEFMRKRRFRHYVIGGLVAGVAVPVILLVFSVGHGPPGSGVTVAALLLAACGALVAGVFWWIVFGGSRRKRAREIVDVFD